MSDAGDDCNHCGRTATECDTNSNDGGECEHCANLRDNEPTQ